MKTNSLPPILRKSCVKFNLIKDSEKVISRKITDGVSSDIWHIRTKNNTFCIKRALGKLTVKEDWYAPVSRSNYEAKYFKVCKKVISNAFPSVLGHDSEKYILALQWFDKKTHRLWKDKLLNNVTLNDDALKVSEILGKIHFAFFEDKKIERAFTNDKTFHDIRIEPYLLFTSKSYPSFQNLFSNMAKSLKKNKRTLIHGDFSPKNILIGKSSPVVLDAETACWGDPVFDLAFCLNHIILKSILHRKVKTMHVSLLENFINNYFKNFDVSNKEMTIKKLLMLLPMLMLARVDGKSPVEYLKAVEKEIVRDFGKYLLDNNVNELSKMKQIWNNYIG